MTERSLTVEDQMRQEHAWLAASLYHAHDRPRASWIPGCGCEFCVDYRLLHGDDVDPWVGQWSTQVVVMR